MSLSRVDAGLVERDASGSGGDRRDDRSWSAHRAGHGRERGVRLAAEATDVAAGTVRHGPGAAQAGAPQGPGAVGGAGRSAGPGRS